MKLAAVATIVSGKFEGADVEFTGVSIDTRTLKKGNLYVAIPGPTHDGHDYISDAMSKGAAGVLVSQKTSDDVPHIQVKNTLKAMGALASYERDQYHGTVIALTGSCGKTTTKMLAHSILSLRSPTLATEGTLNNHYGVPLTLLRIKPEHHFSVIEMGANHAGEIAQLTHMAKPNVALITNVAPVHVEGFGSVDGFACAKGEIFQGLAEGGIAIINEDDAYADFWKKRLTSYNVLTFGLSKKADVRATDVRIDENGCPRFELWTPAGVAPVHLKLLGEHNVMNALAAAAIAHTQGIAPEMIQEGLENATAVTKRLVSKPGIKGSHVIDDTYNANPQSMLAAMQVLSHTTGPKIMVMGDMLELGPEADQYHRELGERAAKSGIDSIYCYGDLTKHTVKAFNGSAYHYDSHNDLIDHIKKSITPGTTVLVKGSKGMTMWKVSEALTDNTATEMKE